MKNILEVADIEAGYCHIQILWGITLNIKRGEIVSIIGPNSSGKTTLIKVLTGLLIPYRGNVKLLGKDITGYPPYKLISLGIIHVSGSHRVFPDMTVLDNLRLGWSYRRKFIFEGKKTKFPLDFRESLCEVERMFPDISVHYSQLAGTLSGGEQQMLGVARGMLANPDLFVLDEPSIGLSPKVSESVFSSINGLREKGVTVLLVEQNVHFALRIADYTYVLESGRIALEGVSKDLLNDNHIKDVYLQY